MDRLKEITPILKSMGANDLYMNLQENRLKTFRNWPFSGDILLLLLFAYDYLYLI